MSYMIFTVGDMSHSEQFTKMYGILQYFGDVEGLALRNFGQHELIWTPAAEHCDDHAANLKLLLKAQVLYGFEAIDNQHQ